MSDEDLASIVVYIRSLNLVRNVPGKTEMPFPLKYLIKGGVVATANITPDASGISYYDENTFIHAMREG